VDTHGLRSIKAAQGNFSFIVVNRHTEAICTVCCIALKRVVLHRKQGKIRRTLKLGFGTILNSNFGAI
jgi:hypothetical protein